ncbi:MAG: pilus assembly PilX N-terminal domain-containing protein [Pseudohongiellaceae bacterium]
MNPATHFCGTSYRQGSSRGSVLLITLIFLVILTLAATTGMRTSIMEMRMAGNEQSRVSTLEMAQSIVDEVVGNADNIVVSGDVGFVNCTPNLTGCTATDIVIDTTLLPTAEADKVEVAVVRLAPALTPAPRGISSSADAFYAARFEVDSTYDGAADNEGKAGIVQGVLVLVPRGAQTN